MGHNFDWQQQRTLVDQRRSPLVRLSRAIRSLWLWVALAGLLVAALFNADVMRSVLQIGRYIVEVSCLIGAFLFQFILLFWFLSRSRTYEVMPGAEGVSFKDYRGQPEVLEQARQMVTLLRGVRVFEDAGGEPLNGLLLEGPPGTGKTWLAQAISTEAGVPYYYVDTSSLQAMFIGVGAIKVMRMYGKARKAAKEYGAAVIFLDEIDAIGSRAGVSTVGGGTGGRGFFSSMGSMGVLSTMLIEMSGFSLEHGWRANLRTWWYKRILRRKPPKPQKRILTIGATNRVQALDPALLRPGRFDKKIRIDPPDMEGRRDIFAYYLAKMAHDDSMNPVVLAAETPGYTPADIKYVLNETLRYAFFAGREQMTYADFQRAKPEHEMGLRSPIKHMSAEGRERIAYREAATALAVRVFLPHYRIARVTIVRQGELLGHVSYFPAREAYQGMRTKEEYLNRLRVAVASKAAEIEFCGAKNQTLGYGREYERIRSLLRVMAGAGMLGPLGGAMLLRMTMNGLAADPTPAMAQAMEETFQRMLGEVRRALRERSDIVAALKERLLDNGELLADDIRAFFDAYGLPTPEVSVVRDGEEFRLTTDQ
jgi:cell division protease FtsH